MDEPGAQPRQQPAERGHARAAGGAGAGDRVLRRARDGRGAGAGRDHLAGHGRLRRGGAGQRQPAAPGRAALRPAATGARRPRARARRQGDHLRHGRHLAQAGAAHGGHEGRHGRRRRGDRGDRCDRRARSARARDHRRRGDREHAERPRLPARRHHHRGKRQDDRGHEHRRRRTARPRRRALVRARPGRDAHPRPRHADRRDGGRARRLLRRHLRQRGLVARPGGRGGRGQRRPRLAVPDAPALPPLRRLRLRRHEELVGPATGRRRARGGVPRGVRRGGAVGPCGHRRPGLPRTVARRLPQPARRHRLRRSHDRRARLASLGVNFDLSPEHELVRSTVREFAEQRVAPVAAELDREHRFPYELVTELAELGLMGMTVPEEYGGAGTDTLSYAIAVEELTRIDSSVAITMAAHTSLGTMPILLFGNEEQKRQWLPDLASGRKLAAFGLTEPGAGSDAAATRTTAELRDGRWVVNGSKIFITNAGTEISSCVTITARTGEDEISNLIVPNGTPGYEISPPMRKMGWRASDTRELSFKDARVPEGNLLGERGKGFHQFLEILDGGRISVAAMGTGLAQGAYDLALKYAREREQFGKPIASFQAIQFQFADMAVEVEAGRNLVYKAAWLKDEGREFAKEAAMAKLYTGELSHRVANQALQIHGGYGYMDESAISRLYRDQKILEIGEGTNEVQRMVIARHLGL